MNRRQIKIFMSVLAGALALVVGPTATAHASSKQAAIFQDDRELLQKGDTVRRQKLDEIKSLGADVIKFQINWSLVAPRTKKKPAGFDGSNLKTYPPGAFSSYDALIREANARGLRVLVALTGQAPGWATAKRGDTSGVDRPNSREFGRFARAVGVRYNGSQGLPRVDFWTIWNEPNNPRFLAPAATRGRTPKSPHVYRGLVQQAVKGLRASGHSADTILFGEILPIGKQKVFRKNTIKPLLFMREMFCLDRRYHRFRGRAAKRRGCQRFKKFTGLRGFAYHPYTRTNGPRGSVPSRDDATVRYLGRVAKVLDRAHRRGRFSKRRAKIYISEFGFQSNPPDRFQTRLSRIPGFLNESEWLAYRMGRVATYSQYLLDDEPCGRGCATWQGGLRFSSGREKPGVYGAYRSPIFVRRLNPGRIQVWGAARPGGRGTRVQVQQRRGKGGYKNLGGPITVGNVRGYFVKTYGISKASSRRYRITYTAGGSNFRSRQAKAVRR